MSRSPIEPPQAARMAVLRRPWGRVARLMLLESGLWDPVAQRLHAHPAEWCAQHFCRRADIWVAGSELRLLTCAAEIPLAGPQAVAGYARQLFTHYHGTVAQAWPLATWQGSAGRGASALQGPQAAELLRAAAGGALVVRQMRPLWTAALHWAVRQAPELQRNARAKLMLVEGSLSTRITLRHGRCADVHTARLPQPTTASLAEALQLEQARSSPFDVVMGYGLQGEQPHVEGPRILGSLEGAGPPAEWLERRWSVLANLHLPAGSFELDTPRPPPRLAWLSLACATAVLVTALLQAHGAWQARRLATTARDDVARAPAPAASRADAVRVGWLAGPAEVSAMAAALHHPWPMWLQGIEAVSGPKVQWLEIDFDAQGDVSWRLRGQALDQPSALLLARQLAQQAEWSGARLARLQQAPPGTPVAFEIHAAARPGNEATR